MSDGSITRGIPSFSPTSKAFLQFPTMSDGINVLTSLQNESYHSSIECRYHVVLTLNPACDEQ